MKITVLIENTNDSRQSAGLACEHGLSLYIEYGDQKYLLDAGSSDQFLQNARTLHVPLDQVDAAFLSHGHFDHSGGFASFLRQNDHAPLFLEDQAAGQYYSEASGKSEYIGIPDSLRSHHDDRMRFISEKTKVADGVWLLPHSTPGLEKIGEKVKMYQKVGDEMKPDNFQHEMSLVLKAADGLAVFNSCTHSGLEVVVKEVEKAFPDEKITAFVGGLHMRGVDPNPMFCLYTEQEIQQLALFIRRHGNFRIWTGHCTGVMGFHLLEKYLGEDQIHPLTTGLTFEI